MRGEISIESVLYFPVVLMIALAGFHFAALLHAGHIGSVAASRGASILSSSIASSGDTTRAIDEVNRVTTEMGGNPFANPQITQSSTHVSVTVVLVAPRIVPFLPVSVARTATSAKESFIEEQNR